MNSSGGFCLEYFSHGGINDNGRFFWHTETPLPPAVSSYSSRKHRLSDTGKNIFFLQFDFIIIYRLV
jgi:hypothetical protein